MLTGSTSSLLEWLLGKGPAAEPITREAAKADPQAFEATVRAVMEIELYPDLAALTKITPFASKAGAQPKGRRASSHGGMNTNKAYPRDGCCVGTYTENLSCAKSTAWGRSCALIRAISTLASGLKARRAISVLLDKGEYSEKITFRCRPGAISDDSCAPAASGSINSANETSAGLHVTRRSPEVDSTPSTSPTCSITRIASVQPFFPRRVL